MGDLCHGDFSAGGGAGGSLGNLGWEREGRGRRQEVETHRIHLSFLWEFLFFLLCLSLLFSSLFLFLFEPDYGREEGYKMVGETGKGSRGMDVNMGET